MTARRRRRVAIIANRAVEAGASAQDALRERLDTADWEVLDDPGADASAVDVLVLLGGDGFLLETLVRFGYPSVPIFGVNFGTVGFHMNPQASLDTLAATLLEGTHAEDTYAVLAVRATLEDGGEVEALAFNDMLLERRTRQSVRLRVWVDDVLLNRFAGDGFVVATSAGSTAYNLAAGGPVVHPDLQAMVLTPLYPHQAAPFHSVQFSLALPLASRLRFHADDLPKRGLRLVADGRPIEPVTAAEIFDSGRRVRLLRVPTRGFPQTLSKKIIGE